MVSRWASCETVWRNGGQVAEMSTKTKERSKLFPLYHEPVHSHVILEFAATKQVDSVTSSASTCDWGNVTTISQLTSHSQPTCNLTAPTCFQALVWHENSGVAAGIRQPQPTGSIEEPMTTP